MPRMPASAQARVAVELDGGTLTVQVAETARSTLADLCAYASRRNPKRGFLFVSKVLGKHLPVRPSTVLRTHQQLAAQLGNFLAPRTLFIGFAETATGLGAGVFEACLRQFPDREFAYLQTTRYRLGGPLALDFHEEHSHSTGHKLHVPSNLPPGYSGALFSETLVLVDDELSTGKTAVNFIKALRAINPRLKRVVLVSLLNWMGHERKREVQLALPSLQMGFASLLHGQFEFAPGEGYVCPPMSSVDSRDESKAALLPRNYGRLGEAALHPTEFESACARLNLDPDRPVHVIGDGEFMHPPLLLAAYLERRGFDTWFQSTTRSPILSGHAIASRVRFEDHYGDGIENYIYNLPAPATGAQLVLCHESEGPLHLPEQRHMKTISYRDLLCA